MAKRKNEELQIMKQDNNMKQNKNGVPNKKILVKKKISTLALAIFAIFTILLLSTAVLAIGIKPAKKSLSFTPNKLYSGEFVVVKEADEDLDADVEADGDLAQYISITNNHINSSSSEPEEHTITYSLKLPSILPPGDNIGKIVVTQRAVMSKSSDNAIYAKLQLSHKIIVAVPYPDKYVSASLDVKDKGSEIGVTTVVKNVGAKDIQSVKPSVDVNSITGNIISVDLGESPLPTAKEKIFAKEVNAETVKPGMYQAIANVLFDESSVEIIREFKRGIEQVELQTPSTVLAAGEINAFSFDVINQWNRQIKNVYGIISLMQDNQSKITSRTDTFTLEANEKKTVTAFIDARALPAGKYDAKISAVLGNSTDVRIVPLMLQTPGFISSKNSGRSLIIIILGILLLGNIALLFVLWRKSGEETPAETFAQLDNYISSAKRSGMKQPQIVEALVSSGWPRNVVEERV